MDASLNVCMQECAGIQDDIPWSVSATGQCHPLDKYHSLIRVSSAGQNIII